MFTKLAMIFAVVLMAALLTPSPALQAGDEFFKERFFDDDVFFLNHGFFPFDFDRFDFDDKFEKDDDFDKFKGFDRDRDRFFDRRFDRRFDRFDKDDDD